MIRAKIVYRFDHSSSGSELFAEADWERILSRVRTWVHGRHSYLYPSVDDVAVVIHPGEHSGHVLVGDRTMYDLEISQ